MGAEASSSELGSKNLPKPAEGISADKRPFRSRRLRSPKRPRQTLTSCTEVHQKHITRMQWRRASNERPIRTQCKGDLQLPSARKGRGWICGPESPASTASGCSRDHNPTKKRLAEAETPTPLEARNHSQVVVLASIDLRSQHGRLVSARFSASFRKGVQGSCNRAASQAAGRAYRIMLQRSRPRRGEKEGSKGFPGQKFSKSTVCVFRLGRST